MGSHQISVDDAAYYLAQLNKKDLNNMSYSELLKTFLPKSYRARRFKRLEHLLNAITDEYPEMKTCLNVVFTLLEWSIKDDHISKPALLEVEAELKKILQGEIFEIQHYQGKDTERQEQGKET